MKRGAAVAPASAEGQSTRMARATERLFGQTFGVRVKPSTTTKNETQLAYIDMQRGAFVPKRCL
jgi:hypothetical protein